MHIYVNICNNICFIRERTIVCAVIVYVCVRVKQRGSCVLVSIYICLYLCILLRFSCAFFVSPVLLLLIHFLLNLFCFIYLVYCLVFTYVFCIFVYSVPERYICVTILIRGQFNFPLLR